MKPGDILLLKEGLLGLGAGENAAIFLSREKGGKQHVYTVFTLKGQQRLKQDNVVKTVKGLQYRGQTSDSREMNRFLQQKVKPKLQSQQQKKVELSPRNIEKQVNVRKIWNVILNFLDWDWDKKEALFPDLDSSIWMEQGFSPAELAQLYFHPKLPMSEHVQAIKSILSACEGRGTGYFRRTIQRKQEFFFPYAREEMTGVEAHVQRLQTLKGLFVEWVEEAVIDEVDAGASRRRRDKNDGEPGFYYDDSGRKHKKRPRTRKIPKLLVEDPATLELEPEMKAELDRLLDWTKLFFKHGGFNWHPEDGPVFGLGETDVNSLPGFTLEKFIHFFALDLTGNQKLEPFSAFMELLLTFNKVSYREASELLLNYFLVSGKVHFHLSFRESHLLAASRLPDSVREEDKAGRKDLTELETYTIDPADAKDFDDAISFSILEAGEDGNSHNVRVARLWVHIADVSHYVLKGDVIDDEARFRATSVYLPIGVLPMLPEKLSNHLCSLVAEDLRLAVSTRMDFELESGRLLDKEHCNSVIRVDGNLSYEDANLLIDQKKEPFTGMNQLSLALKQRHQRLNLDTPERKLRFTEDGTEFKLSLKMSTNSTRMIEQFMVITNEAVASTISDASLPGTYRIHPLPDKVKIDAFNEMCKALGHEDMSIQVDWEKLEQAKAEDEGEQHSEKKGEKKDDMLSALLSGGSISFGGFTGGGKKNQEEETEEKGPAQPWLKPMDPSELKELTTAFNRTLFAIGTREQDHKTLLSYRLLRTMPRATYHSTNHGHFGLNSQSYCHFTSPIRRYPDILIHRALKVLMAQGQGQPKPWEEPTEEEIERMVEICNEQSRSAESLEYKMIDIAIATRLSQEKELRDQRYQGMVTGITPGSIFVNMDGFSEGRFPLSRLGKGKESRRDSLGRGSEVTVDECEARVLRLDQETGEEEEILRLGQRVACSVYRIDIGEGRIELTVHLKET